MSMITHFSDLRCWQNARQLTSAVYLEDALLLNKDFATRDQFRRASLSVMNNLAEGFTRFSVKEQIRFYEIAQSSAAEVESMLFLFETIDYLPTKKIEWYKQQTRFTRNQILAFIKLMHTRK